MHAFDKLHEECGVFGIYLRDGKTGVVPAAYHALYALQHRGQESCGIAVNNDGVIDCYKDVGLVNEVFTRDVLEKLHEGSMAVGHCRYGTTGTRSRGNAQPMLVNHLKGGLALCHNGNLVNARELREELELGGAIFHTTSDTEVIAYIVTQERLKCESIEQAVLRAMERIEGAYSLVIMSPQKLIAARDPHGFRPLCMGDLDGDVVFASESCALDAVGATFVRDVEPGETVVVSAEGVRSLRCGRKCDSSLCVFEFIYFARPRQRGGRQQRARGAPARGRVPGAGPSRAGRRGHRRARQRHRRRHRLRPPERHPLRHRLHQEQVHRPHLHPAHPEAAAKQRAHQAQRRQIHHGGQARGAHRRLHRARHHLGPYRQPPARGRGTEVHMRLTAPPFRFPCYFGTDIDSTDNLIAAHHSVEEIAEIIGVDSLGFLSVEHLPKLADHSTCGFCEGCFTGNYPVDPPRDTAKLKFERSLTERQQTEEGSL